MAVPDWFQDLPAWAQVPVLIVAVLVVMMAATMSLGVVFAAIAIGVGTGSTTVGVLSGALGLAVFLGPLLVFAWVLSRSDAEESVDEHGSEIDELREQYVAGEIDEKRFEQELEGFLDDDAELDFGTDSVSTTDPVENDYEREQEREW